MNPKAEYPWSDPANSDHEDILRQLSILAGSLIRSSPEPSPGKLRLTVDFEKREVDAVLTSRYFIHS